MQRIQILLALILSLNLFIIPAVFAAPLANVIDDHPVIDFPNTITFHAKLTANSNITDVILEYGTEQQTCGDVIAKAFPDFTPGKTIDMQWAWDMRQSGSLPPGTTIWWRWRYTEDSGQETVSDQKTITWLDNIHNWQTIISGELRLHWYNNDKAFAQKMLDAGVEGLSRNAKQAGLKTGSAIYIY